MKRIRFELIDIAERNNVALAVWKAAKGKRSRDNVRNFFADYQNNISSLTNDILQAKLPYGDFRTFTIYDPKERIIHAACFEDRIFHHALMNIMSPVFERAMVSKSYACRINKGVHKAAKQVQENIQKYPWFVKIDIDGYFSHIQHELLLKTLKQRFKGRDAIDQIQRVIMSFNSETRIGLPIGSLTSQFFANYFLDSFDRYMMEHTNVKAYVRYMDDMVWWCETKQQALILLKEARVLLEGKNHLTIKDTVQINQSNKGVSYCGFRIVKGAIRLTPRKRRRYQALRQKLESEFYKGNITERQLQSDYASVLALTAHTDSEGWRGENLIRHPDYYGQ